MVSVWLLFFAIFFLPLHSSVKNKKSLFCAVHVCRACNFQALKSLSLLYSWLIGMSGLLFSLRLFPRDLIEEVKKGVSCLSVGERESILHFQMALDNFAILSRKEMSVL